MFYMVLQHLIQMTVDKKKFFCMFPQLNNIFVTVN